MTKNQKESIRLAVSQIIWMARRYANGRKTYAPHMFNEAYDVLKRELGEVDQKKSDAGIDTFPYALDSTTQKQELIDKVVDIVKRTEGVNESNGRYNACQEILTHLKKIREEL